MTSLNIMVGSVHICLKNKIYIEIKHVSLLVNMGKIVIFQFLLYNLSLI